MTLLSGCDKRNSREWLENKVSEVSRVYPTENLFELFEEFPDGFSIVQSRFTEHGVIKITMIGDSTTRTINGNLVETEKNKEITNITIAYEDNKFIFSDEAKAKELWPVQRFLFQDLSINKKILADLKMQSKSFSFQNGDFDIKYEINNHLVNDYLKTIDGTPNLPLEIHGSNSNKGYYYSVVFENHKGFSFSERVSDGKN